MILLTAWTQLETAVELVKAGAADYLAKPWDDAKLLATVENLLELAEIDARARARAARAPRRAARRSTQRYDLGGIVFAVGRDGARGRARVPGRARRRAGADHRPERRRQGGDRRDRAGQLGGARRAVRRASTAARCRRELIEAELFGAEGGAYTGANRAREGRFEAADGGTLFLDEIGNLPLAGQMKLLRVLETGRFERLGSNRTRQVKVRVISATNADLPAMIRAGTFREDLYYRLNVDRARACRRWPSARDDILPLAEHFLGRHAARSAMRARRAARPCRGRATCAS